VHLAADEFVRRTDRHRPGNPGQTAEKIRFANRPVHDADALNVGVGKFPNVAALILQSRHQRGLFSRCDIWRQFEYHSSLSFHWLLTHDRRHFGAAGLDSPDPRLRSTKKKPRKISGALKKPPRTDRVEVHPGAFQQFTSISRMDASKIKKEAPAGDRNCFEWFHYHGFIMSV
jgi:hypothetical protein